MINVIPTHGLDNTIVIPVVIGVLLLLIFSEIFGWGFAGYVVPGYLGVVFLTVPEAGAVIVWEAIVTYILVYVVSEGGAASGLWSRFFGRERFLLFVVASIVVRVVTEYFLLDHLLAGHDIWLAQHGFYSAQFRSIGLVLVPLLANSFWRPGLFAGVVQSSFITLLTTALVAFVLARYTNYSLELFALAYEEISLQLSAGSKAQILLLVTAAIAALYNLRFGWDFNGILVPALLTMALFEPTKLLATFAEAIATYAIFLVLMRTPFMRGRNLGGGRRLLLLLLIDLAIKWAIATMMPSLWQGMRAVDLFGIGYVLPSMIAAKIEQKHGVSQVVVPTLITLAVGFTFGSALAGALAIANQASPVTVGEPHQDIVSVGDAYYIVGAETIGASEAEHRSLPSAQVRASADVYQAALETHGDVCGWYRQHDQRVGLSCTAIGGTATALFHRSEEAEDRDGRGGLILFHEVDKGLVVVVEGYREDFGAVVAWLPTLRAQQPIRAVFVAARPDDEILSALMRQGKGQHFLRLRTTDSEQELRVHNALPPGLSLAALRQQVGPLRIRWQHTGDNYLSELIVSSRVAATGPTTPIRFSQAWRKWEHLRRLLLRPGIAAPLPKSAAGVARRLGATIEGDATTTALRLDDGTELHVWHSATNPWLFTVPHPLPGLPQVAAQWRETLGAMAYVVAGTNTRGVDEVARAFDEVTDANAMAGIVEIVASPAQAVPDESVVFSDNEFARTLSRRLTKERARHEALRTNVASSRAMVRAARLGRKRARARVSMARRHAAVAGFAREVAAVYFAGGGTGAVDDLPRLVHAAALFDEEALLRLQRAAVTTSLVDDDNAAITVDVDDGAHRCRVILGVGISERGCEASQP